MNCFYGKLAAYQTITQSLRTQGHGQVGLNSNLNSIMVTKGYETFQIETKSLVMCPGHVGWVELF